MSGAIPDDIKQKLLQDPQVQAALKNAGQKALEDPEVQRQIAKTAQEKFPQYAATAGSAAAAWAQDPNTQAQAKEYGLQALGMAGNAGGLFLKEIEQGPDGVKLLAFIGGVTSAVLALMQIINPLGAVFAVAQYVICTYLFCFSLTCCVYEMPVSAMEKLPRFISEKHDRLMQKAPFLSDVFGRGLFYIFIGSLWLMMASFSRIMNFLIGLYMTFMGVLNVLMHFGVMPKEVASKMRSAGGAVYQKVSGPPGGAGP